MAKLTDKESTLLLESAKIIYNYKLMQTYGYKKLVGKAEDDRTRQLLAEISANELNDAGAWLERIKQLANAIKEVI